MTVLRDLWAVLTGRLSTLALDTFRRRCLDWEGRAILATQQRDEVMTQLLAADEEIFRMSQCGSWDQMQPIFARLREQAEARRRHVSNSIGKREIARIREEFQRG